MSKFYLSNIEGRFKNEKHLNYYNHITYAHAFGFCGYVVIEAY